LAAGELHPDPAQTTALGVLQELATNLQGYHPAPPPKVWQRFLCDNARSNGPRGLYIYGSVGRGKSMLMDLFFEAVPIAQKRRVHFHQFMLEIHERLHRLQSDEAPNILPRVAREIAAKTWVLCFDEFHVANIADAMILGRLFQAFLTLELSWSPPPIGLLICFI